MAFGSEIARLFVRIGADTSELQAGLKQASSATNQFASGVKSFGNNISQVGRGLTAGLTLPIIGLGAIALKASIDFESAFAGVRKTVDATEPEFAQLRQGIRDMAKEMPLSASKIAEVAEAAGQLGVKKDDILAFTKTMVKVGAATNLSANEAATGFARLANIMQVPIKNVDKLADVLVNLGNKGASTEKEILDMALRIAGAAQQIGISAQDVLAFANALSSVGVAAEEGGSAISRTFIDIAQAVSSLNPTPEHLQEISDATRDVSDASDNLASAQRGVRDASEGVASAQRGVRDALQGVADAQRGVRDASEGLAAAHRNSRNATEALRDAQANLTRAYRDQRQASLDARRETLSVAEAFQGLREVQAQAGSQSLEYRSAQLAVAEAQKRVREAAKGSTLEQQQAALGLQQAQQRLNQVMVQGPRYAIDLQNAQLRLAEAQGRVGQAAQGQADKIQQAQRNVRNSTEGVSDAQKQNRNAAEAVAGAQRNLRNANEGVDEANRNLRNSQEGVSDAQRGALKASRDLQDAQKKLDELTTGSTSKLKLFADVSGMSVEEFSNLFKKDAKSAVLAFVEGLGKIKASGGDVFGTLEKLGLSEVRQRDALLRLAGGGDVLRKSFEDAASSAGALDKEFEERSKTAAAQLAIKWNEITDSLITLGDTLKPIMMDLLAAAQPFFDAVAAGAEAFAKLPKPVQQVVVGFALLLAALGPLALVIGSITTVAGAVIAIGGAFAVAVPAVLGFAAAFGTLMLAALPWIALAAAIVVAGYLIYKNWDLIKAQAVSLGNTLVGAFNAVKDYLSTNWREVATLISGPFLPLVALATDAFGVRSALWGALKAVWDWVKTNWATIGALISSPFLALVALAFDLFGLRSAIVSGLNSAWRAIVNFFNKLKNIKVKVNTTAGGLIPTGFSVSIPSYETGTAKVPQDMLAFLHQGEMVVPRNVADQVRNGVPQGLQNFVGGLAPMTGTQSIPALPSSMQSFIGGTSTTGRKTSGLVTQSGTGGGDGSASAEIATKSRGGLHFEINGPVKVQNIGRRQDAKGALGDLAFGVQGQLNRRGIYA